MNLEHEIQKVSDYLDEQGVFVSRVEFGKFGNGTAALEFKYVKKNQTNDEVKQLLEQFGKKSLRITSIEFTNVDSDDALGLARVACSYDFTQTLDADEIDQLAAAKGAGGGDRTFYKTQEYVKYSFANGAGTPYYRDIYVDKNGKYYTTKFWRDDVEKSAAKGKVREITAAQANATDSDNYGDKSSGYSC